MKKPDPVFGSRAEVQLGCSLREAASTGAGRASAQLRRAVLGSGVRATTDAIALSLISLLATDSLSETADRTQGAR